MQVKRCLRSGDVQSIHRALDILEVVRTHGEIGSSQLSRELGLAVSTVHSLVRTLAGRGYLVKARSGYRLGPGVVALAWEWDASSLSPVLLPALRQLATDSGHAATATVLVGDQARKLGYVPAPGPVTASAGSFEVPNPLTLATGRVLIAMQRRTDWGPLVKINGVAEPSWSAEDWLRELERIAASGVSVKVSQVFEGQEMTAVAVPVYGPAQSVFCSIGCSMLGHLRSNDLQRTLDVLWKAGVEVSSAIGGSTPIPQPPIPSPGPPGRGDSSGDHPTDDGSGSTTDDTSAPNRRTDELSR